MLVSVTITASTGLSSGMDLQLERQIEADDWYSRVGSSSVGTIRTHVKLKWLN